MISYFNFFEFVKTNEWFSYLQTGSSGSDYWSCSECKCSSTGTWYTCPDCQDLLELLTHDDTRPPSEEDLPLEQILASRARSRLEKDSQDGSENDIHVRSYSL